MFRWFRDLKEENGRIQRENRELRERIEKQNQFIENLAQKFPEVRKEFVRYKLGWKKEEEPEAIQQV